MKITKACLVVAVPLVVVIVSVPVSLGQTPTGARVPTKDLSGNDRYPLPKEGLIPDKETAIKIAEVVLFRLYGEDAIKGQRPYVVRNDDYIWWIHGTLPKDTFGTTFNIGISKHTGAILSLTLGAK